MATSDDVMPADAKAHLQEVQDQLRGERERFAALPRNAADRTPEQEKERREIIMNRIRINVEIAKMELQYDCVASQS